MMVVMEKKFELLQPWLHEILGTIRRDIKTDYLPASAALYRTHFGNRPQNRLTVEEINIALSKELLQGNSDLAEWVINRWVFKHGELYSHFAERLEAISPEFATLKALSESESEQVLRGAKEAFGAKKVYFFSVLNEVVFPQSILEQLRKAAEAEQVVSEEISAPVDTISGEKHQKELARLTEKYEQKIAGIMKKYTSDVEALKTHVRALQKKLG
jgi:hypothetical protein